MIKKETELSIDDFELKDNEKRVADILVPGQQIEKLPDVSLEMLEKYYQYLSQKLPCGLLLTGRQTLGYFVWEEKFDFGYGSKKEYERLKKQNASCYDKFKLVELKSINPTCGIITIVSRASDRKKFYIPLVDLEAWDESSNEYLLLEDYSMWFVNYKRMDLN